MKPPKCPKCGAEINTLTEYVSGVMEYSFYIGGFSGGEHFETRGFIPDEDVDEFRCPKCDAVLFDHQLIEAANFLRGE